jgi:hypothetical protein
MEWKVAWKLPNNTRALKEAEITKPEKELISIKPVYYFKQNP